MLTRIKKHKSRMHIFSALYNGDNTMGLLAENDDAVFQMLMFNDYLKDLPKICIIRYSDFVRSS